MKTIYFFIIISVLFWSSFYSHVKAEDFKFSPAHSLLLKEIETINVNDDGSYEDVDEVYIKIIDQKGRQRHRVQRFFIDKNYSTLNIIKFEIIKPNKQIIPIDWRKHAKEVTPSSSSQMNIYDPNQKVLTIFIPALSEGDILHYVIRVTNFKPMIPGHFFGRVLLQQTFPIKFIKLVINLPKNKKFYYLIKDRIKKGAINFFQNETENKNIYKWTIKNVPELVPEPNMVDISRVAMRLLFSTISSWKQVSKWYYNLVEPKLKITPNIEKTVENLIKDKKELKDKIAAIFFFVSRKIRYMGLIEESNRPGFEPHDVALTFSRRYGVCRDKAALLVAMLRAAGINAVPAIIKAGGKLDPEIPVPYFNHAIVAVIDNNQRPKLFLDPTSETATQFLPDYEQDSSCLLATSSGSELILTPIKDPNKNLFLMNITSNLSKNGKLYGHIEISAFNFIDTAFRSILMYMSKEDQRRYLEKFFYKRNPKIRIKELWWLDPTKNTKPFKIKCTFIINNAISNIGNFYPLSFSQPMGLIDEFILSKASTIKRKYPLKLKYTFRSIINEKIYINFPVKKILFPNLSEISDKYFTYFTKIFSKKNNIEIKREFINRALEIPASEYNNLLKIQAEILKTNFIPLIFKQ